MSYGGVDSSNGTYGPVGASTGSEPQPSSGGTVGPAGPAGPPGPNIDRYAATRIVSADPDQGTDLTIQAAIDNLPSSGGTIFLKDPLYQISASLVMPDKNVVFVVAAGTKLVPVGNIALFAVPNGLTDVRTYQVVGAPILEGDPGSSQTVFQLDDANGRGSFELRNAKVTGFSTFVDWLQYDLNYINQSNVRVYRSVVEAVAGGAILAKTPNPAGSFFAPVAIRFSEIELSGKVSGNVLYAWSGDADCDLWFDRCSPSANFSAGCKFNGLMCSATYLLLRGAGDYTFNGNAYDIYDFMDQQSGATGSGTSTLAFSYADTRLIFNAAFAKIEPSNLQTVAVQLGGQESSFKCGGHWDGLGLSNPGVEITSSKGEVGKTFFKKIAGPVTVFPQGCIKITSSDRCKVHHCDFDATVTGKTVLETGSTDKCCIHDNTGFANGTGNTVNINGNDQVHNNINT